MQYGLRSLQESKITFEEFLNLNWNIGGWKQPSEMVQEAFPFFGTTATEINKALTVPGYFDPWSRRNMNLSTDPTKPAPRTAAATCARDSALRTSGMVFTRQARSADDRSSSIHGARARHAQRASELRRA